LINFTERKEPVSFPRQEKEIQRFGDRRSDLILDQSQMAIRKQAWEKEFTACFFQFVFALLLSDCDIAVCLSEFYDITAAV